MSQLELLFDYLKHVKEDYFCWVVYFNEELGLLNIKLCREDEVE